MRKFVIPFLCFVVILAFASGCQHEPIEVIPPGNGGGGGGGNPGDPSEGIPCSPDSVYFVNDVLPIINSNCAFSGCHGDGSAEDGVDFSSYSSIINTGDVRPYDLDGSDLYEVITENDDDDVMPPPPANPLSDSQIATIAQWINQGALNNSCGDCDTVGVTFSGTVSPIIQNNCQGCHSGGSPSGDIFLRNYNEVVAQASTGRLYGAISHADGYENMPYNQAQLSECKLDQIRIWIEDGMPNN